LAGGDHVGLGGLLGVSHPVLNPITGLFGIGGEAYGQWRGMAGGAAGVRALANVPFSGIGAGADWRVTSGGVAPIFTFHTALRRGGLFGHGTTLRLDWLPPRHEIDLGVNVPLAQPFAGRTRPRSTVATITVPSGSSPRRSVVAPFPQTAEGAIGQLARDASLITAYTNLYPRGDQQTLEDAVNKDGWPGYTDVMRSYDESLVRAFGTTVSDEGTATLIAAHGRAIVFDQFILPYDTLFGQVKSAGATGELLRATRAAFARWLSDSSGVPAPSQPVARVIFDRWTDVLADVTHGLLSRWKDSRLVWVPAQLALALDDFDEQAEVDSIVGRAAGHPFTDNNELAYLRTADLPLEIARSIMAARRYHVLWTHDFTGRRPSGQLDDIAFTMVADAYLPALTAAVQRYDSAGTMPQYFVLLDAFYYHGRYGRMWMSVLENPLTASMPLRDSEAKEADHLRERLTALRNAVAHSARLQREAATHGGSAWLNRVVRVNVNILLPSDFTFRSARLDPPIPFTPDNVARDHRKLALYDFTENDPYGGDLLVTGIGIGEHYASATWEDRGYRLRGPAALEARAAVRRALRDNGLTASELPETLRDTDPPHAGQADGNRVARVLHVQNEPGFGSKRSSAARAMLYTLAPPGSDIIIPDPLWLSESWAGMVLAAAARGCNVAIITPSRANSPNPEPTVLAREHDVLRDMFAIRQRFATRISSAGGAFHIGIYAAHAPVTNPRARLAEVRAGLARAPWIRALIPFDSAAIVALNDATMLADRTDAGAILADDERPREPQLHQKTQLIARPGAIAALVRQPGWERVLARTLITQSRETAHLAEALAAPVPAADTSAVRAADRLLQAYDRSLTAAERKRFSFYFVVGSQNHDTRGLLLDGEANVVVSGFEASAGLVDLFYLMARTTWVDSAADVDRLVPSPGRWTSKLARLIRLTM
jgi:hypothetical protein